MPNILTTGFAGLLVCAELAVAVPPAPDTAQPLETKAAALPRVHDPSTIVRCEDEYWFFSTGMGITSRHSKDLISWTPGPPVFTAIPGWVNEVVPGHKGYFWAPDIIHLNDRYLLYYSVSAFGKNTSAIALVTSSTLDPAHPEYRWTDQGIVIQSSRDNNYNAIDPGVFLDADGRLWMTFGSFWSGIKLVELDPATGKRKTPESPPYPLARHKQIEAPALVLHDGYYYLFMNWGLCCRGLESTYNIRVGRSKKITGPYLDRDGVDLLKDGGTLFLETEGRFVGPGHAAVLRDRGKEWVSYHFYDRERKGAPALAVRELRWTGGWPEAGAWVSPGK